MLKNTFQHYINNFRGFSREIWILTIVTFINRAGTMVLPFLTVYLKDDLHFSYDNVGWVMVCFGSGSMLGSWLGGKLSDKIGFYKVMIFSLLTSGMIFFCIQFITSFYGLCIGMFLIMTIADMFRPAMFVSLATYSKPENRTRALTLVRLAVNLGFAAGPALGGLIIMSIGYRGLFWADGSSCIISILIFAILVKEKKKIAAPNNTKSVETDAVSVFNDHLFWLFLFVCFITSMLFFQLFTTLPLYYHEIFSLTEFQIGLLMMLNGLIIFIFEMPIVSKFEQKQTQKLQIILWGSIFMAMSLIMLLVNVWAGVLIINIIFMSFAEMFIFPFSNSFAMSRAPKGFEGRYMALYTMCFSLAHIASSKIGMAVVSNYGYQANWFVMGLFGVIAVGCCLWARKMFAAESS